MRKIGLTIAVVAALSVGALSAGTAAAPVLAASNTVSPGAGSAGTSSSARAAKKKAAKKKTARKKAAKKKALRKCKTKRLKKRRKACRRAVTRRFSPKRVKPASPFKSTVPVATIDVRDDYFSPDVVNIKSGESIEWVWYVINHDPHNVTLTTGPAGVERLDFQTATSPAESYRFKRTFIVPGTYNFSCSLHKNQKMTVNVS